MMLARLILITILLALVACGRSKNLTCDDGPYLSAVRTPRVEVPEDLDSLEELKEMPLPEASPQAPRPADSTCLDVPPLISTDI